MIFDLELGNSDASETSLEIFVSFKSAAKMCVCDPKSARQDSISHTSLSPLINSWALVGALESVFTPSYPVKTWISCFLTESLFSFFEKKRNDDARLLE